MSAPAWGSRDSQRLGSRAKPSCKFRDSQNSSLTFQLHSESSHSKDQVETGELALKAKHVEKRKGKKKVLLYVRNAFPYTLRAFCC